MEFGTVIYWHDKSDENIDTNDLRKIKTMFIFIGLLFDTKEIKEQDVFFSQIITKIKTKIKMRLRTIIIISLFSDGNPWIFPIINV